MKAPDTETLPEGETVVYTCESKARPPPILKLDYGEAPITFTELQHEPPVNNITPHSPEYLSKLTWTTKASKEMHGKELVCKIKNNPSAMTTNISMSVFCKCNV